MAGELRAIETVFRGHKFRSRLEARYAVLLHELGVPYRYEDEGYELEPARYLPDFVLPTWEVFAEVKPIFPTPIEIEKARSLARDGEWPVLFLIGQPWPGEGGFLWVESDRDNLSDRWSATHIAECRKCDGYCLVDVEPGSYCTISWSEVGPHTCGDHEKTPSFHEGLAPRVWQAYRAARGARFEFGAQG